jgi:hypothetical protein
LARQKTATKGASKSDVIRAILKQRPSANVKEVKAALAERGVKASDALINKIKYGRNRNGASKKSSKRRKQRSGVNKAEAIRGAWGELGARARPRDVIALLAARGINVASAQVSTLRKGAFRSRADGAAGTVHSIPFEHLVAAKGLAARLGGIQNAQHALSSLAKLVEA